MIWKYSPLLKPLAACGEALLRLVYPAFCALCRRALTFEERSLCGRCFAKLKTLELPRPEFCKTIKGSSLQEALCLYTYSGELKELWTQVKFKRRAWLLPALRDPLQKFLLAVRPETRYDYLVPVPVTLWSKLERHYNPAGLFAEEISRLSGIPAAGALKKVFSTPSQRHLSREERQNNLRHSLAVRPGFASLYGRSVLVVDDILTTGATARECARVLKQAGAAKTGILTLAQTPERFKN